MTNVTSQVVTSLSSVCRSVSRVGTPARVLSEVREVGTGFVPMVNRGYPECVSSKIYILLV